MKEGRIAENKEVRKKGRRKGRNARREAGLAETWRRVCRRRKFFREPRFQIEAFWEKNSIFTER